MENEYLQGVLIPGHANDARMHVLISGQLAEHRGTASLETLGMQRWSLVSTFVFLDEIHVIFQRQKLYPVGEMEN